VAEEQNESAMSDGLEVRGSSEDLGALLHQAVGMVKDQASFLGVNIDLVVEEGVFCRTINRDQLVYFFVRCLQNSFYSLELKDGDRCVWVTTARGEMGKLKLVIGDNGRAANQEVATKWLGAGPCQDIRKENGGSFSYGLDGRGRNVISVFLEEVSTEAILHATSEVAQPASDQTIRILIVEDFSDLAHQLELFLLEQGYAADIAADGYEALRKLRNGHYNLILTDLKMPGVDGGLLIRTIANEFPEMIRRVVVMSSYVEDHLGLMQEMRISYIRKPFSSRSILLAVRTKLKSLSSRP
jgi:CheY-like chemotaxis protein